MAKGQALAAPILLVGCWVAVRIWNSSYIYDHNAEQIVKAPSLNIADVDTATSFQRGLKISNIPVAGDAEQNWLRAIPERKFSEVAMLRPIRPRSTSAVRTKYADDSGKLGRRISELEAPTHNQPNNIVSAPLASRAFINKRPAGASIEKRLSFYGYSFWRDNSAAALAPRGQYGGSQIGIIAAYRLNQAEHSPAIFGRLNGDGESFDRPEAALGMRLRPLQKIPIEIAVERRFRQGRRDSSAAYLAGGVGPVSLPYEIDLNAYAQAGLDYKDHAEAEVKKLQHFYDANMKLERHVAQDGALSISAGAGIWAGGQRGVNRIDAGPSVNVDFGLANTKFRLSADYRFRAVGNPAPRSGPAFTLTTSY